MEKFPSPDTQETLGSRARMLALLASVGLTTLPGCVYQSSSIQRNINGAEMSVHKVNHDVKVKCNALARDKAMTTLLDGRVYECPPTEEEEDW